jgi:uncharacterized protein (DUF433 family)
MDSAPSERIVKTPGTCGGRARIAGHRVRVQDIVIWYEHQGMTPDEIVSHIPSITLADVHSALAYYFDHVTEIQEEMRADRVYAEEFRRNYPSMLDAKLGQEPLNLGHALLQRNAVSKLVSNDGVTRIEQGRPDGVDSSAGAVGDFKHKSLEGDGF